MLNSTRFFGLTPLFLFLMAAANPAAGQPVSTTLPPQASTTTSTTVPSDFAAELVAPGPGQVEYEITTRLADPVGVGALQYTVDYTAARGEFKGSGLAEFLGGTLACSPLLGDLNSFNDNDAGSLRAALLSLEGITGPIDIGACTFVQTHGAPPAAADFAITVQDASNPNSLPIVPVPLVVIGSILPLTPPVCGNGAHEFGEECDNGAANSDVNADACRTACVLPRCGDGAVDTGEICDDGNASNTDACLTTCQPASCGDGFVRPGIEQCDQGALNSNTIPDRCRTLCVLPACGDAVTDTGEACDDGPLNSDTAPDACRVDCSVPACGDGVTDSGEGCDDGNTINSDACLNSCVAARCGDGVVRAGVEECDDGNTVNTDACLNSCATAKCGDGVVRAGVEECDDGNTVNTDACLNSCATARCGDGIVHGGIEECDDGALVNGDGCSALCELQQMCGDPTDDGLRSAVDALAILRVAVGLDTICPTWICDVNHSGRVTATDAQTVLLRVVGGNVQLTCGDVTSVRFRLNGAVLVGSLALDVNYGAAPGSIPLLAGNPDCTPLVPGMSAGFAETGAKRLSISTMSVAGMQGPVSFAECKFVPTANVDPEDFMISVIEALAPQGAVIDPPPSVIAIPY